MQKRRQNRVIGSTRSTTKSIANAKTYWPTPMPAAKLMLAQPVWTQNNFADIAAYGEDRWLRELRQTSRQMGWMEVGEMVEALNRKLQGWANYFYLGPVTKAYRRIDRYTTNRLRRWYCKKHKVASH